MPIIIRSCTSSTLLAICFYFSAYTAHLCTPSNACTTLSARSALLLHYFIVEIVFCKFSFYFWTLFLTLSHDFRIVSYMKAQFTTNMTLAFDSAFRFIFCTIISVYSTHFRLVSRPRVPRCYYQSHIPYGLPLSLDLCTVAVYNCGCCLHSVILAADTAGAC